ncbi:flagellar hook-associated protein FlgL [Vibrio astriarenae]
MRVTDSQFSTTMQKALMDNNTRLNRVFEQMSSGLRINHLSDDPVAIVKLEGLEGTIAHNEQYQRNISNVQSQLSRYEMHLTTVETLSQRINELLIQGKNGTLDEQSRAGIVLELESLKAEVISILNSKDDGSYIFSGTDIYQQAIDPATYDLNANNAYKQTKVSEDTYVHNNMTITDIIVDNSVFVNLDLAINELTNATGSFSAAMDLAIDANQGFHDNLLMSLSSIGSRYNNLERLHDKSTDLVFFAEVLATDLKELDYAQASVELNQGMMALEATQKTFASISGLSLFKLL